MGIDMAAKRKAIAAKPKAAKKTVNKKAGPTSAKPAKKAVAGKPPAKKAPAQKAAPRKTAAVSTLAGKAAPAFSMMNDEGRKVSLKDFRGQRVILYFYPKDDTPGCTTEACAFRDAEANFAEADAVVLGVSKDNVASHKKFKTKYKLNFPLLVDESGVAEAYGVWKEKNMYGRKYMGVERSTFLIDEQGKVRAEWRKVSVPGHADEVIKALTSL